MDSVVLSDTSRLRKTDLLSALLEQGAVRIPLLGHSMRPWIPDASRVAFSARLEPQLGDVVLFHYGNSKLVAHRVIALDEERIWTKGDACATGDSPVVRSNVLAVATELETLVSVPLRNPVARRLGLLANRWYPRLARAFRAVWPRAHQRPIEEGGTPACES